MDKCIFCQIIDGSIKSDILFEDENMIIIEDITPIAPKHFLAIPKEHYSQIGDSTESQAEALGKMLRKIPKLKNKLCFDDFRLVINQGNDAGQTVMHLHVHILAGKKTDVWAY